MTEVVTTQLPSPEANALPTPESTPKEEWRRLTGALLHEIDNSEVQSMLMAYGGTPVSETLPHDLLSHLPATPLLGRLQESSAELSSYAARPPVEDDRITPDLREAWWDGKLSDDEFFQVSERYAMARDVKLLALGAELRHLRTAGEQLHFDATDTLTLPSGIEIHGKDATGAPIELLDPTTWEGREQLKDRVYVVTAAGKKYVLKEQKTDRHTDTLNGGHRDLVPVAHEFKVGQQLAAHETPSHDNVHVKWERPLGYVTYPDGFQFGMYAYEEGLGANRDAAVGMLTNNILADPEAFADEFAACSKDMQRFMETPAVQEAHDVRIRHVGQWVLRKLVKTPRALKRPLSFVEFAEAKATQMFITAHWRQSEAKNSQGLADLDDDGTLYRVPQGKAELEILGLDYERYRTEDPDKVKTPQEFAQTMADFHQTEQLGYGAYSNISDAMPGRQRAALLSLLERSDSRWAAQQSSTPISQG